MHDLRGDVFSMTAPAVLLAVALSGLGGTIVGSTSSPSPLGDVVRDAFTPTRTHNHCAGPQSVHSCVRVGALHLHKCPSLARTPCSRHVRDLVFLIA